MSVKKSNTAAATELPSLEGSSASDGQLDSSFFGEFRCSDCLHLLRPHSVPLGLPPASPLDPRALVGCPCRHRRVQVPRVGQ
eukprot:COSAG04_NODE_6203_length_1385_cov_2.333593_3_plen_81_part_01